MKLIKFPLILLSVISISVFLFSGNALAISGPFTSALSLPSSSSTASTANQVDLDLGTGDFTIECFFKLPTGQADSGNPYLFRRQLNYYGLLALGSGSGDIIKTKFFSEALSSIVTGTISGTELQSTGVTINAGTWYHIAIVRSSTTLYIFFDGSIVGQCTITNNGVASGNTLAIGGSGTAGETLGNGSGAGVEEFRMSNTAQYTSGFTPTTSEFSDCTNVKNLWHFNSNDGNSGKNDSCTGTGTNTLTFNSSATTAITLASFTATPAEGKVLVEWETATEKDNAGFNILRSKTRNGKYVKINSSLIAGAGDDVDGKEYSFTDEDVKPGRIYYYKLEDIDIKGESTFHGPVKVKINYKKKKK